MSRVADEVGAGAATPLSESRALLEGDAGSRAPAEAQSAGGSEMMRFLTKIILVVVYPVC